MVSLKVHWVKISAEVAVSPRASLSSLYSLYSSGCRGENTGDCGNTHTDTHTTDTHTWAWLGTGARATWGCEPQERLHTQGLTWIWTRLRAESPSSGCGDPPVRDLLAPNKFSVKFNYRKHLSIDWLLALALPGSRVGAGTLLQTMSGQRGAEQGNQAFVRFLHQHADQETEFSVMFNFIAH